jgi:hypothetical protein
MKKELKKLRGPLNQISERSENENDGIIDTNEFVKIKQIETSSKVVQIMNKFKKVQAMNYPTLVDCK